MRSWGRNSDTAVLILHEIYGINRHISGLCESLSNEGFDVFAPNFIHQRHPFAYSQETIAYDNFINNIGFERTFLHIRGILKDLKTQYSSIFLLGFSVGATVAWICSQEGDLCSGIIGFYGSRIRDYSAVEPKCPVLLFFPSEEPSFDINILTAVLSKKENLTVKLLPAKHGFTDPFSPSYNRGAAKDAKDQMLSFFRSFKKTETA